MEKEKRILPKPIKFDGFEVIGYYPYSTARLRGLKIPRKIFAHIENDARLSGIIDNKIVLICQDTVQFGTDDFALFLHDAGAIVGTWEDIQPY